MIISIAHILRGNRVVPYFARGVLHSVIGHALRALRMELLYFPSCLPINLFLHP